MTPLLEAQIVLVAVTEPLLGFSTDHTRDDDKVFVNVATAAYAL
jgi:hypothetical protein